MKTTEQQREYRKQYYAKNKEKCLAASKRWFEKNPGYTKEYHKNNDHKYRDSAHAKYVSRTYGIDVLEYLEMVKNAGGICAICGRSSAKRLSVDHDHETGKVRGLLCAPCNLILGYFENGSLANKEDFAKYLMENG